MKSKEIEDITIKSSADSLNASSHSEIEKIEVEAIKDYLQNIKVRSEVNDVSDSFDLEDDKADVEKAKAVTKGLRDRDTVRKDKKINDILKSLVNVETKTFTLNPRTISDSNFNILSESFRNFKDSNLGYDVATVLTDLIDANNIVSINLHKLYHVNNITRKVLKTNQTVI